MKKIAIFQTDLNVGGIQKSLINLLNNVDYKEYKIDLYLTNKSNYFDSEINKNVNVKYLKKLPYFTKLINFKILNKFYKRNIKEKYDVAIDFNSYSMDTSLACINAFAKKKVIWVHNDIEIKLKEEKKYRVLYHFFKSKYKYFDEFVAVSNGALDSFKKHHNYEYKRYNLIPNFIDTKDIIKKSEENCNINVDKKITNICSVGRITHQKGFDILVNDIKKLTEFRTDFKVYIIGDGEELNNIKEQVQTNELNDYFVFTGNLKNPYSLMKQMDAFILESRYEGQGMVFLEAQCLGLDIIMPKHLEKYVDIKPVNNVLNALKSIKKNNSKKLDQLTKYNNNIENKINDLFTTSIKKSNKKVLFISSTGGHFTEMMKLKQIIDKYDSYIATEKTKFNSYIKEEYKNKSFFLLYGTKDHILIYPFKLLINCFISLYQFIKIRPDVVITTGAHTAGPMCCIAKIFRKKIIFIETMANINKKTVTGRLVYKFADLFIVQWESMLKVYPKAVYKGMIY